VLTSSDARLHVVARQVFLGADSASEADKLAKNLEFSMGQEGNEITANSKYQNSGSKWFSWGSKGVTVSFLVTVPSQFEVKAHTSGGDMAVSDLVGRVNVRTSGGDINLGSTEGEVDAITSGGNIEVEEGRGRIKVVTRGGDIRVNHAVGEVRASTSGGNVHIDRVEGVVNASTSGGNAYARFESALTEDANLSTSGGHVTAWLRESTGADLDASTSGGRVTTEGMNLKIDQGAEGKNKLAGEVNEGGPRLKLRTRGGNIRVKSS
jgi:hypothetical protein